MSGKIPRSAHLTAKQTLFVAEYLVCANAALAARRAGYSARTARFIGAENLTKPNIAAAIKKAQDERARRTQITSDHVVEELASIAFARFGDFYDQTGRMLEVHQMPPEVQARLSLIKFTREKTHTTTDGVTETSVNETLVELRTWDKVRSLSLLAKHLGLFTERAAVSADVSLLEVCRAIERKEDAARQALRTQG